MKKIGDITSTADKNGEWTNGNVAAGIPPTILESGWLNSVQREILNVLLKAGVPQDKNKDDQLVDAIGKIISNGKFASQESVNGKLAKDQNGADIPDKLKFIENLGLLELLKKKVDHAKYINDKANIPEAITSQGTGFYRTSATVTGTNIDSELGYSLFWAINLSGNIGALCVNRLGNLYFSNDCAKWERAASINDIKDFQKKGNYAVTDIDELAGNKAITSQIKGNLATSKKTNSPYPPDSPVGAAFKILQIGDDSWPSLLLFDSYTNKAFLATRKSTAGEFNPFLRFAMMDDVLGSGQSYIDVTSSRSLGSTYTNSTGRTIFVMVTISRTSGSSTADVKIDGINVGVGVSAVTGGTASNAVCFPVPANSKYSVSIRAGEVGLTWSELR